MKPNLGPEQRVMQWLGLTCLGLTVLSPLSAQPPKLRHTLKGHKQQVFCVAYSPDGRTLASGSVDETIKLWDLKTGKERATLKGHTAGVQSVAYSPDGKTLASGGEDETIKLWDIKTGQERATLTGHTDWVKSVVYSPDGQTLASGSDDKTIKLWDIKTGKERATFEGHTESVFSVAYSPDGKTLASGSWDKTIKLWDVAASEAVSRVREPQVSPRCEESARRVAGISLQNPFAVPFGGGQPCIARPCQADWVQMLERFSTTRLVAKRLV
jgi:WD40 repeat protein